jgi:hypothetical protein
MNVRIRHDLSFSSAVYYAGQFRVNHYTLRLWMTTVHPDQVTHNIALERIKHFVYQELDSTVFINAENIEQCRAFINAGLDITTLPTEPVDQIIGIMLYYKLNAIMEQHMIIVETELASILGDNIVYLHSDNELTNIEVMSDWWQTADLTHCDQELLQGDKVLSMPQASAWRDLDLAWPEYSSDVGSGNVVVFADFKNNETK